MSMGNKNAPKREKKKPAKKAFSENPNALQKPAKKK